MKAVTELLLYYTTAIPKLKMSVLFLYCSYNIYMLSLLSTVGLVDVFESEVFFFLVFEM